jgi:hypothetical protein
VGPNAVRAARAYFGCATLEAVELENGGGAAYGAGEHWERRVLFEELMTAVAPPAPMLSAITFGLLLDTGWYRLVNSSADLIDLDNDTSGMTYGRGLGCAWATQRCDTWPQALNSTAALSDAVGADAAYFCTTPGEEACGYDGRFIGSCTLGRQAAAIPVAAFQYFNGVAGRGPEWGGDDLFADYCPYVRPYATNGLCTSIDGVNFTRAAAAGMSFGDAMYCVPSAVAPTGYSFPPAARAGCYRPMCESPTLAYLIVADTVVNCSVAAMGARHSAVVAIAHPPTRGRNVSVDNVSFLPPAAATAWSFAFHGVIDCGQTIKMCRRAPPPSPSLPVESARSPYALLLRTAMPRLRQITPSTVPLSGGTRLILTGTGFTKCAGLRIGGVPVTVFTVYNDTLASAVTGAVNFTDSTSGVALGGANDDGTGPALVQLMCGLTFYYRSNGGQDCSTSNPCAVSSDFLVNYSAATSSSDATGDDQEDDLLQSTGAKFLIVVVPVVLIGAGVVAVRRRYAARDAADGEAPGSDGEEEIHDNHHRSGDHESNRGGKAHRSRSLGRKAQSRNHVVPMVAAGELERPLRLEQELERDEGFDLHLQWSPHSRLHVAEVDDGQGTEMTARGNDSPPCNDSMTQHGMLL